MTPIPERTIERLCNYRRILFRWHQQLKQRFHSHELAKEAAITPAQVRRDMMSLRTIGTPKNGYLTDNIIEELGLIIEGEGGQKVVLVGVGKLGSAIINHLDDMRPDLRIVAAFDIDPAKINQNIEYTVCLPVVEITRTVRKEGVLIAIIAVPSESAQEIASELVEAGVCALVNFTSIKLKVPPGIFVQDIDIAIALEKSAYFARTLDTDIGKPAAPLTFLSSMKRLLSLPKNQIKAEGGISLSHFPSRSFAE